MSNIGHSTAKEKGPADFKRTTAVCLWIPEIGRCRNFAPGGDTSGSAENISLPSAPDTFFTCKAPAHMHQR